MACRLCCVLRLLSFALFSLGIAEERCQAPSQKVKTSSLVQRALLRSHVQVTAEDEVARSSDLGLASPSAKERTKADDARFLMHATFGPTRAGLAELQGTNYTDWVRQQMQLPVESHREYYRQRANPRFHPSSRSVGAERLPCTKGSRWHSFAFTVSDVGKRITVQGSDAILVDGVFRTNIEGAPLASDWVGLTDYSGYICFVAESIGADVHLFMDRKCDRRKKVMPNPAIWLSKGAIEVDFAFDQVMPGIVSLHDNPTACQLNEKLNETLASGDSLIIKALDGKYYRHESRLQLLDNTRASPSREASACVPRNSLNERHCRPPTFATKSATVAGLRAEFYKITKPEYASAGLSGAKFVAEFVDPNVNHPETRGSVPGLPSKSSKFAVRWTGTITIQQEGDYEFFLSSDDGSRLTLDDELVVNNDGEHSWKEKKGSVALGAGDHAIVIEFFEWKGAAGIVFEWKGPDSAGKKEVVPSTALSTPEPVWQGCLESCGSPGEVANSPVFGHLLPFYTSEDREAKDKAFDSRYADRIDMELGKSMVWTAKVLQAQDQLRQRMAWSLSQIFVVSTRGIGDNEYSELWLNFYDIFVRHAFGNFRDVLQEVTYSPLMGKYLTHTGSSSYSYNQRFPNENYAREVMQLFTIGLDKLNPDGSIVKDADGNDVATYGNKQILNFARVFTGFEEQPFRANYESKGSGNKIDPMQMYVDKHDVYPKPDLDGNYIGDGVPLCSDEAEEGAFLAAGARYEFRGPLGPSSAPHLSPSSPLFAALCGGSDAVQCRYELVVKLPRTLTCSGEECSRNGTRFVKVGMAFYEYIPPVCVHLFFREATANVTNAGANNTPQAGLCADTDGQKLDQSVRLDSLDLGDTQERQTQCLAACRAAGASGCQLRWSKMDPDSLLDEEEEALPREQLIQHLVSTKKTSQEANRSSLSGSRRRRRRRRRRSRDRNAGCYAHFLPIAGGNGYAHAKCWDFNDTGLVGHSYVKLDVGNDACPAGTAITSIAECRQALKELDLPIGLPWIGDPDSRDAPTGCSSGTKRMHWSTSSKSKADPKPRPVCRAYITLDDEGELVQPDGGTKFAVKWYAGHPAPGIHPVVVKTHQAFTKVPSSSELKARLRIGAAPPLTQCSECDGEVKAYYGSGSALDADTVFELDGKYYKNVESLVVTVDGQHQFRNPPVYLRSTDDDDAERSAIAEVEALLDHLFHHSNTPVFIGRRLIQRFVTSTPSPSYVRAVGEAFQTGTYGGATFSGQYGDLAATVAAILLHPEATGQVPSGSPSATNGALREPLLKFIHLMRSMEYQDGDEGQIVFQLLQNQIGQFPYQSPTVFNYYLADYELPMPKPEPEPEPEVEPEAEPEPEPEPEPEKQTLLSPEFQIFTPPFLVGYLNGMSSLIKSGVSGPTCDSYGGLGVHTREISVGVGHDVCPQGSLTWQGHDTMNETLEELDLLLTGGRLTPVAQEVVKTAYKEAPKSKRVQAAQQAIVMTAEFNTLGSPTPLQGARNLAPAKGGSAQGRYKAVVMLFLSGGADTFNMLVPQGCDLYKEYREVRTDLALKSNELLPIQTSGQVCRDFGIHGAFRFLKTLYDKGQAAFVSNIGPLVEPTTKQAYRAHTARRCLGLFSHSDQQRASQTLKCQELGTRAKGAGGRMADSLAAGRHSFRTNSYSMNGAAAWPQGIFTQREIVDGLGNGPRFVEFEHWRGAIGNITAQRHGNPYSEAYAEAFRRSIETTQNIGRAIEQAVLKTDYQADSRLQKELKQVAKLISSREGRGAERDFFWISAGGWDHHSDMKGKLDRGFGMIDRALRGFVEELKAQKVWDSVVLVTESEFGRTLDSNGGGSDHGWAGNHIIISGDLRGKKVFNKFPASLKNNNDHDLGRGRMIPDYPWESVMVPIAEWMGVEQNQLATTFPNLGFFNSSHIIPKASLFRS